MSGYDMSELGVAFGGLAVMGLVAFAFLIFAIICMWKIYTKMGEPGWVSLIPFYNNWVLCKHTWGGKGWMMFTWLIPVVGTFLMLATMFKMYKGFGKSGAFAIIVGMLLSPIALIICAFGNADYADQ